ncbi:unnamed protein product [Ostreobium quekettii]|uniref:Uncharacterized protein n=1 Tax=Ostreobium quekettii TaxID=121088 RepID=A0A8S1IPE3_9CHLO|nr:unnamed protein product [Ostreobium quekettii]
MHGNNRSVYYCPTCRRSLSRGEKQKMLYEYEGMLREQKPVPLPKTMMDIFAADLHQQYVRTHGELKNQNLAVIVEECWALLPDADRGEYERKALRHKEDYLRQRAHYMRGLVEYKRVAESIGQSVPPDLELTNYPTKRPPKRRMDSPMEGGRDLKHPCRPSASFHAAKPPLPSPMPNGPTRFGSGGLRGWKGYPPGVNQSQGSAFSVFGSGSRPSKMAKVKEERVEVKSEDSGDEKDSMDWEEKLQGRPRGHRDSKRAAGQQDDKLLQEIPIVCNSTGGIFLLGLQKVICGCSACSAKPEPQREFTATQFEQHCGAGSAKKWKSSLRVKPGALPEVPKDAPPLPIGKWLELKGIETKASRAAKSGPHPVPEKTDQAALATARKNIKTEKRTVNGKVKVEKPEPEKFEPWQQVLRGGFSTIKVRYAGDRCAVCDGDVDYDCDQLITCDACGITVHQTCYGIPAPPENNDVWLCDKCQKHEDSSSFPQCCLCPVDGGALKQTDIPGLWCHVACMQWIPEVTVADPVHMAPIRRIQHIQKERWELTCCLCKQRMGAKVQCGSCYSAYHPLCARMAGLHMEMQEGPGGLTGPLRLVTYCPRHCKPRPELAGIQRLRDGLEGGFDEEGVALWNGQPFKQPPAVPVPALVGCARSQPLVDWERKSHGTGAGFSSTTAFWIPVPPKTPPRGSDLVHRPFGRAPREGGGRFKRSRTGFQKAPRLPSKKELKPPTEQVDLLPLPDGIPEEVPVECNGKRGSLLIRSQRVLYADEEMTASRFEQLCGKGEAKKWKCSLWYLGPSGCPELQMHDWLAMHGLDRRMLANLQANWGDYEAYQQHQEQQVGLVLQEMLQEICGDDEDEDEEEDEEEDDVPVALEAHGPPAGLVPCEDSLGALADSHESDHKHGQDGHDAVEDDGDADNDQSEGQPSIDGSTDVHDTENDAGGSGSEGGGDQDGPSGMGMVVEGGDVTEMDEIDAAGVLTSLTHTSFGRAPRNLVPRESDVGCQPGWDLPEVDGGPAGQAMEVVPDSESEHGVEQVSVSEGHASGAPECESEGDGHDGKGGPLDSKRAVMNAGMHHWGWRSKWLDAADNGPKTRLKSLEQGGQRSGLRLSLDHPQPIDGGIPGAPAPHTPALRDDHFDASDSQDTESMNEGVDEDEASHSGPVGTDTVGRRVAVWWNDDAMYYTGTVDAFDSQRGCHIRYDDGDEEWLDLTQERVRWGPGEQTRERLSLRRRRRALGAPEACPSTPKQVPEVVQVVCNGVDAQYIINRTMVKTRDGKELTPTEFERVSGKGSSKKWKASIRIAKEDGSPGKTLGDWLVDCGLDVPRTSKAVRTAHEEELAGQRRQRKSPGERRKPQHRANCMCIICKQARRKVLSSPLDGPPPTAAPAAWRPATTAAATRAVGPRLRAGKRAYMRAVAQLVRGASRHAPWEIPQSECWSGREWEARQTRSREEGTPEPAKEEGSEESGCSGGPGGAMSRGPDGQVLRSKMETWREQLRVCQATERERITFGKSGIHGWGLFARKELAQDSMIIEYRGDVVSPAIADLRENSYRKEGKDCYLFHINDDLVIDATMRGAIGRFTNHCCAPSMYTKTLEVDGEYHLCFFARTDVKAGQELTYDYRFKEEAAENKIKCFCGAPNCRGYMN